MEYKHTPLPWTFEFSNVFANEKLIAICNSNGSKITKEDIANTKLIAAAPELLEALNSTYELAELMGMILESNYWTEEFREKFNTTITKAELIIMKATE